MELCLECFTCSLWQWFWSSVQRQQLFDKLTQGPVAVGRIQNDQNMTLLFKKLTLQCERNTPLFLYKHFLKSLNMQCLFHPWSPTAFLNLVLTSAHNLFLPWPPSHGFGLCNLYFVSETLLLTPLLSRRYQARFQGILVSWVVAGRVHMSVGGGVDCGVDRPLSPFPESSSPSRRPQLSPVSGLRYARKWGE